MFNWLKNLKSQMNNADVTVSKQSAVPRQPIKRANPHRILICDDAAFMRMLLKDILTKNGYEVIAEAQDGLEAIERYYEFKPDLVFMDIDMPKMDGLDATITIKGMDSHANIVVCSAVAQAQQELVMEAIRLGAKDFIVKPYSQERILAMMTEIEPQLNDLQPNREVKRIKPIYRGRTANTASERTATSLVQPQDKQTQTISTTPPTQTQILDEQKLLNYIKEMPVQWEFNNPNVLQNESLKKLCTAFISSESVSKILNPEMCASMELLIQQKRARYPRTADYNKAMDVNLLFELYKYAYLMAAFQVLENRKNDTLKIDRVKFWNLVQTDCHKRLENLEQEKRNNPAVCNMLQKYEHDTQKVKMVVNDYVEPREYDYICASLMTNALLPIIIDYVLGGEINIGNGYQKTLQIIRQYPANDLMAALDASLSSITSFTLGMYANGGRLPRRPQ